MSETNLFCLLTGNWATIRTSPGTRPTSPLRRWPLAVMIRGDQVRPETKDKNVIFISFHAMSFIQLRSVPFSGLGISFLWRCTIPPPQLLSRSRGVNMTGRS